jgi:hypothetical protein
MSTQYVFKKPEYEFGLGNLFIQLAVMPDECRCLHDNVYDYELANCVVLNGFTRVSYDGEQPDCPIYINPVTVQFVHPKIRTIVEPTRYMQEMIAKHAHLLDGVTAAMSVRRGSYCDDSRQYKGPRGDGPNQYFCSPSGLERFKTIIRSSPGRVFLSSDSVSTTRQLVEEFGDKLSVLEMPYTVTSTQDQDAAPTIENLQKVYLKWFLLSKCPKLYLTGGKREGLVGFSTYAYIAAIYGAKPFELVFNEDFSAS